MRKLKLLLVLFALLVCAGVQAQKDVTSQYITNATLSNGTTGWTNVNFNAPVQGNNTVGYASECYAGWGNLDVTNYSLTQTITLPAGHYTLVNYSFYRYGLNADTDASLSYATLKAGDQTVPVKTLGSISASGYANSQAEGANAFDSKMYRNAVDFTIDADNTPIEIGLVGTHELKQSWMICGMFELINNDIPATMDAPFDVTGYITNPGFEYRNMTGWTQSSDNFFQAQGNNQGFKVGGYYAEKWQASGALPAGSMSQTLTNLPAGFYQLTANLGGNGTYVSLNGKTANWEADKDYTVGYVLGEGEDLTITAGKTAEGTANWIHFDNFKLHFCGDVAAALTTLCAEVTEYESKLPAQYYTQLVAAVNGYNKTYSDVEQLLAAIDAVQALYDAADLYIDYAAALAAAQLIDQDAKMNNDVLAALQSAITTSVSLSSTAADIVAATNALNTATVNATASIANYTEAKGILDAANSYDEAGQASYAANETIAAIRDAYENGTLTAVSDDQKSAAAAALVTACKAQVQPKDGSDMSVYIFNAGINGNADGWTCNKYGNTDNTGGPMKPSNDALEYWGYSATNADAANRNFDYYQVISDLPNGVYTISADLWNSTNGEEGANWNGGGNAGLYGKTESAEVIALVTTDADTFSPYTTDQIFVYNGTLTIGVKNIKVLTGRWFVADNFKLTYVRQLTAEDKNAVTSAYIAGSFNDWNTTDLELTQVGETNSYSCELDIEDFVDVTFKPVINGNWMDFDKFTMDASNPAGWLENAGGSDNNIKLNNRTAEFKTYTITATWTPQLDVTEGWTLKIEGKDARPTTTFTASFVNNGWDKVCAHVWNGTSDVITGEWPGVTLDKSGELNDASKKYDVYTYSYEGYEAPDHIIFNNGNNGAQTGDLDFVDGMIYTGDIVFDPVYYVIGSNQSKTDKAIFSGNWDAATTTDQLTEVVDGEWTISFDDAELTEPIIFKVIKKNYKEATEVVEWYPAGDDVTISETGTFRSIIITLKGSEVSKVCIPYNESFTVGETEWATAITHYAVDFNSASNLTAYLATVQDGVVTLTEAGEVPAGTPVVLHGTTDNNVSTLKSAAAVTNDLQGSNEYDFNITDEMDAQYNFYGLTVRDSRAQFAKLNKGTIQPGKAYLKLEKNVVAARELSIIFADETTGINTVAVEKSAEGIYNMNGQRVTAPAKGLYIVNGKKVVLK